MRHPGVEAADPMQIVTRAESSTGVRLTFGGVMAIEQVRAANWALAHLSHAYCVCADEAALRAAVTAESFRG
jgi:hypothetical protein